MMEAGLVAVGEQMRRDRRISRESERGRMGGDMGREIGQWRNEEKEMRWLWTGGRVQGCSGLFACPKPRPYGPSVLDRDP